jgi:acetyltransferase-like isoleucine patch superfamily enzyme
VIHETAIVAQDCNVGANPEIGPYSLIGVYGGDGLLPVVMGAECVIRSHCVVYRGTEFGTQVALGHGVLVRENCTVGDRVSIGSHSVVEHTVTMGNDVRIHSNCFVPEESVLDDGSWLGPGVIVTNARYPNRPDTKENLEGVHVGKNATIGAGVILMPGIRIGEDALVGAGTVVLEDVAPGQRVVGNPGRAL